MKSIKHQQQPTHNSCQSTTIAMVLGLPVEKVIEDFHADYMDMKIEPHDYLIANGLTPNFHLAHERMVFWDKIYILGVPSLNVEASTHSVILDTREKIGDTGTVYDPNMGKEGKKYYTSDEELAEKDPLAVIFQSFIICYSFNDIKG